MKLLIVQGSRDKKDKWGIVLSKKHIQSIQEAFPDLQIKVMDISESKPIAQELKDAEVLIPVADLKKQDSLNRGNLKWVHVTSAGVNNLPESLIKSDILVTNSSGVHPIPIAEHVFCFMLMFTRQIYKSYKIQILRKEWYRNFGFLNVSELNGKTIAIIGFGRIGKEIARLAKCFNMKVLAVVRTKNKKEYPRDKLFKTTNIDQALKDSDFIINCLPQTNETFRLFDLTKFRLMKPSSYFINIGRGGTVNEKDLVRALKEKLITGAGLDVFEDEPLPKKSPLWSMDNVIITPHYAGWTPYYMDRVTKIFIQNLKAYLKGQKMPNLINKQRGY